MKAVLIVLTCILATLEARSLTVMQYNAENLFDTKHDEGTLDYTYLPLSIKKELSGHQEYCQTISNEFRKGQCLQLDWNEAKLQKKILNIAKVIQAYDESGNGPDIVALQEIENLSLLKAFENLGYKAVLIEGYDSRGIDVALLTKLPVLEEKLHPIMINNQVLDSRGILEVTLIDGDRRVSVFVNHWPSQSNTPLERIVTAKLLSKLAGELSSHLIIALGDFNTILSDYPYPFDYLSDFIDTEEVVRNLNPALFPGTSYKEGQWRSLDKIFVHKNSVFTPDYSTFRIFHHPFMMKNEGGITIPHRFDHETAEGYSDHLPVGMEFSQL